MNLKLSESCLAWDETSKGSNWGTLVDELTKYKDLLRTFRLTK